MTVAGIWRTDAPITPHVWQRQKDVLASLLEDWPDGVFLRTLEVWIDGVAWEWQPAPEIYGDLR